MESSILSVPLPGEVRSRMKERDEIKWVEVARRAIVEKLDLLDKMDEMLSKSELTEDDAVRIGREINKKVWERHKKLLKIK